MFNITRRITNVKEHMNWKGGGPETVESLPEWMRPYIEGAMGDIDTAYGEGKMDPYTGKSGITAGAISDMTGDLGGALKDITGSGTKSLDYYKDVLSGGKDISSDGLISAAASRQAQESAKRGAVSAGGASQIGSGRNMATQMQQDAINAAEFADIESDVSKYNLDLKNKAAGDLISGAGDVYNQGTQRYKDLFDLGATQEGYDKAKSESDYDALMRRFELYGVGQGATQQATGGK